MKYLYDLGLAYYIKLNNSKQKELFYINYLNAKYFFIYLI